MARDYAKHGAKKRGRPRGKKNNPSHWKLWIFTLALIALFVFILLHLGHHRHYRQRNLVKVISLHSRRVVKKVPVVNKPQFSFYTLLPKSQVKVLNPKFTHQYYLQISSLKKYADADRLKAELALLGFDAYIDSVKEGGVEWNRVSVGPYASKKAALADQMRLQQNKIKSILKQDN